MSNEDQKKKKGISPKAKQIIDIVVTSIEVAIVIVCVVFSIIIWTGTAGAPEKRSVNWFAVRTNSMVKNDSLDYDALGYDKKLCFDPGDMVISKKVKKEDIKVGDVVAYVGLVTDDMGQQSEQVINHRVIEITDDGMYVIAGDKDTNRESTTRLGYESIIGKMTGKLKGVGGVVLWLQGYKRVKTADGYAYNPTGSTLSFLVIIIPLALLFIYNGFYVVKWAMGEKMKKAKEQARQEAVAEQAKAAIDQEAIRKEALRAMMMANGMTAEQIDAYFASQAASEQAETNSSTTQATENSESGDSENN